MNTKQFNQILDRRLKLSKEILSNKAKEYATTDRLHNFKVAARILNTTPEDALRGMMMKHIVSVFDLIDNVDDNNNNLMAATELDKSLYIRLIEEKIGDTINYLILLESLLKERLSNDK